MTVVSFSGIRFHYDEFIADVRRMSKLAEQFLETEAFGSLKTLETRLENLRNAAPGVSQNLSIPDEHPIVTKESTHYRGTDQKIAVKGKLSFVWGIVNSSEGKKRRTSFDLTGIASTRIRLFADGPEPIAHWQLETGDASSPGCHFHSSVNQAGENGIFPKWLKIPRLPGILFSPMDGLEYMLGELFQEMWAQHVSKASDDRNGWAKSQSARLQKVLSWQKDAINRNAFGTPWISLKRAKPPVDVLLEE